MLMISYHLCEEKDVPRPLFIEHEGLGVKKCKANLAIFPTKTPLDFASFSLEFCLSEKATI